jgi:hypothetical protein
MVVVHTSAPSLQHDVIDSLSTTHRATVDILF